VHQPNQGLLATPERVVKQLEFSPNFDPEKLDIDLI
jgi:hypothetical protein